MKIILSSSEPGSGRKNVLRLKFRVQEWSTAPSKDDESKQADIEFVVQDGS